MRSGRLRVAFLLLLGASAGAATACSDTDPHYGPPEAIRGRTIDYGTGTTSGTDSGGGTGTPKMAVTAFADLYATFAGNAEGTKCTPCHATGGTAVGKYFVATDATSSRAYFLSEGYQDIAKANTFATKGQHSGNPLTAGQKTLAKTWSDLEKAAGGGTTTMPEAGAGD
jgi:hypothetical protein